ncbi:MAG: glycosyltransferase [Hyphomicrobiales bacterium]|nr:glycosyltransferase [Hyphomicrobiales bacterium]
MKAASPRFSVLLPTHNRPDVLGFAIASVLAQSEPDFELLIVADGCTDSTREVVGRFSDDRIRLFDLAKAPYYGYANRNVALREARGRIIAYAAHDDLLLPDHLALIGQLIDSSGAAWGYSRPLWVTTDGIIVPYCTNLTLSDELSAFFMRNMIPAVCVAHTRSALEAAGYWPEDVAAAADWALWKKMLGMNGRHLAYLPQPTSLHFSADWKQSRYSGMPEVETLARIAESARWWPPVLRHPPVREPEQATLWRAIEKGGAAMLADLRAASEAVIDRIAWSAIRDLQPALNAASAAKEQAEAHAEILRQELGSARARAEAAARLEAEKAEALRQELLAAEQRADAAARQQEANIEVLRQELLAAVQKADAAARRAEHAASELMAAKRRIQNLKASASWRVTAPLRELFRFARKLRLIST